jgi:hypothetical protein
MTIVKLSLTMDHANRTMTSNDISDQVRISIDLDANCGLLPAMQLMAL